MERLQKIIAECGYTSRRKAEELILKGKVYVNGEKITTLGMKVKTNDDIVVEGVHLKKEELVYYVLNKPRNVVSTVSDDKGRKTIIDLIDTDKRIFPIGRLDYDTTGIIILTNDGNLSNILSHPKSGIPKTYLSKLDRVIEMEDFFKLKGDLVIEGRKVTINHLKIKKQDKVKNTCYIELTITEGRNHIVKKIFNSLGYNVDKLTRISYAFLSSSSLKSGEYRMLTKKEVHTLYALGGNRGSRN